MGVGETAAAEEFPRDEKADDGGGDSVGPELATAIN